ncbi:YmaF family protein [Effusibacillus consociatus]|uniref:YmaF family protein n=1 Tax=Effusibacillus consociatus TaxID=1117041 RepID=A0ABV9Q9T5_9BACL
MADKEHRHELEYIHWRGGPIHFHEYATRTAVAKGHTHLMGGATSADPGGVDEHVHAYDGVTTFDHGHVHRFRGVTGPAIPLPGGGHTHEFAGETSFADGHTHAYYGRTGGEILP